MFIPVPSTIEFMELIKCTLTADWIKKGVIYGQYMAQQFYNLVTLGDHGRADNLRSGVSENSLANMVKLYSTKNTKLGPGGGNAPVIPASREAEAGEPLEPKR